tara:strand:- start:325 stop:795 length:471 start_codon:yes stop_codon:yes gene_type:complete
MNAKKIKMVEKDIAELIDLIGDTTHFEKERKGLLEMSTPLFEKSQVPLLRLARFATKRVYARHLESSFNAEQNPWTNKPSDSALKSCASRVAKHLTEDLDETKHRAYLMLKFFLQAQLKHEKKRKENLNICLLYAMLILKQDFVKEYVIAMECERW